MNLDANSVHLIRACAITVAVMVVMSVATEVIKSLALVVLLAFILTPWWSGSKIGGCLEHPAWFSTPDISEARCALLLEPSDLRLTIISTSGSAMHISDKIDEFNTGLIMISRLPPLGLTHPVI